MPSSRILLSIAMLTAALMAVQSAHRTARACEDIRAAAQAPPAQTDAADEQRASSGDRHARPRQDSPDDVALVTGDAIACVASNAECAP